MILVVDDDEDVRALAEQMLTDAGYEVRTAHNGDEGLAVVEADPSIQLLFTDIVMPGSIDGWELAERAKQLRPDLRVLYASGFTRSRPDGDRRTFGPLLSKPWRASQLFEHVRTALGGCAQR